MFIHQSSRHLSNSVPTTLLSIILVLETLWPNYNSDSRRVCGESLRTLVPNGSSEFPGPTWTGQDSLDNRVNGTWLSILNLLFKVLILLMSIVCVWCVWERTDAQRPWHTCGDQRVTFRTWFFPSTRHSWDLIQIISCHGKHAHVLSHLASPI